MYFLIRPLSGPDLLHKVLGNYAYDYTSVMIPLLSRDVPDTGDQRSAFTVS